MTDLHTGRPIHIGGTTPPCYICWWERKFQGAKVPHLEISLPGANGLGSEKSIIRFDNPGYGPEWHNNTFAVDVR